MIIHAFGVMASPFDVSTNLTNLSISHSLIANTLTAENQEILCSKVQPSWPIILPSLKFWSRYRSKRKSQIIFICDSLAQLSLCNVRTLKPDAIRENLRKSLEYAIENPFEANWKLEVRSPTFAEYVDASTKPSFLNGVQNALYKITPYDLRKTVQALVIGYLAGTETRKNLMTKLNSTYKLDAVKALISDPKCGALKEAVTAYGKCLDVEKVAAEYDVATFEILYLSKSAANAKARS